MGIEDQRRWYWGERRDEKGREKRSADEKGRAKRKGGRRGRKKKDRSRAAISVSQRIRPNLEPPTHHLTD